MRKVTELEQDEIEQDEFEVEVESLRRTHGMNISSVIASAAKQSRDVGVVLVTMRLLRCARNDI
jgi:hypothetical protein